MRHVRRRVRVRAAIGRQCRRAGLLRTGENLAGAAVFAADGAIDHHVALALEVATDWSDSKYLEAEPGDYITVALRLRVQIIGLSEVSVTRMVIRVI